MMGPSDQKAFLYIGGKYQTFTGRFRNDNVWMAVQSCKEVWSLGLFYTPGIYTTRTWNVQVCGKLEIVKAHLIGF